MGLIPRKLGGPNAGLSDPYNARHSSVSWNLMVGKNPLWVAKQHGHSVQTMLEVYAAWTEGAKEHQHRSPGLPQICHQYTTRAPEARRNCGTRDSGEERGIRETPPLSLELSPGIPLSSDAEPGLRSQQAGSSVASRGLVGPCGYLRALAECDLVGNPAMAFPPNFDLEPPVHVKFHRASPGH